MQEQPVIMVQVADSEWTQSVLRSACAWAARRGGRIALVQLVRVQHFLYLGTQAGYEGIAPQQVRELQAHVDLAASCGVDCTVQLYQYHDLFSAICDMAAQVGAAAVFAKLPRSAIPFWGECRFELLRHRLAQCGVELYDQPLDVLPPAPLLTSLTVGPLTEPRA